MKTTQTPRHWRAIAMLMLATAFWGLSFPAIKALGLVHLRLLPESGNWFTAASTVGPRFVIAAMILAVCSFFSRARGPTTRTEWKQGLGIGLFASLGILFQSLGLQFTEASTSAFLTQLTAILIPTYVALRSRRNPGWRVWLSCALVMIGVAILGQFNWRELHLGRGEIVTLISAVFFTGQILWLNRREFVGTRSGRVTLIMFTVQASIFLLLTLVSMPSLSSLLIPWSSPSWVGITMVLMFFCTLTAFLLMNTWQPKITATEAGLIYSMEPIFGSLLALFIPAFFSVWFAINYHNEIPTWPLLIGGVLITSANLLLQLRPPAKA